MPAVQDANQLRTYGRRKGHRLSPRKQRLVDEVLPQLRVDISAPPPEPLTGLFPRKMESLALEIGFGAGEHMAAQAAAHPDRGFIGCEVYINGIAALLSRIDDAGLDNIRIHDGDARDLLPWLPPGVLDQVFILFPDPWPKKRHHKRRLISQETLAQLARAMRPGAQMRLASDIPDYIRAALIAIGKSGAFDWTARSASDWRMRPAGWTETRYERKALREGRRCCYLTFHRNESAPDPKPGQPRTA